MKEKKFSCSLEELNSQGNDYVQTFTEPSMVEPCYNPSIVDMLMRPELACIHQGFYDNGDDVSDIDDNWNNDLQNIYEGSSVGKPSRKSDEVGKPSEDDEGAQSKPKETEPEPGPKED